MSVDAFRKFIAKYGVIIFGIMLLAFIASSFNRSMGCGRTEGQGPQVDEGPAIATIGKFSATSLEVDQIANNQGQTEPGPLEIAQAYGSATSNVIDHLYGLAVAADHGINMDDKAVEATIPSLWAQQVENFKQILAQQGKLMPNATEAEFEAAFKADASLSSGMTLQEQQQRWTDQFNSAFNDPSKRELIRSETAKHALQQQYAMANMPTDDEVKNSFGTYKVLRLNVLKKPGVDALGIAQKALADIKGGMKFEDAIKKYTNDKPVAGKSLTDQQDINSFELQYFFGTYRPILSLKPGDVSGIIDASDFGDAMYSIFKIVKFTPNVPPNFESQKATVLKTMQGSAVESRIQKDMDAEKASGKLQWKSDAYHAMYDFANVPPDPTQRIAALKKVQADAQKAMKSDVDNARVATLAYFGSTQNLYDAAKPAEQKSMTADRIAALERVLQDFDFPDTRLQLATLYIDANRTKDAAAQLELAAKDFNGSSPAALATYENVLALSDKLSAKDQLPATTKTTIDQALDLWRKTMIEEQQIRLQSLKQEEDQKKQYEAAMAKKAADDAKKAAAAKAAAAKSGGKPAQASTGITTPTPGVTPPVVTQPATKPKGK